MIATVRRSGWEPVAAVARRDLSIQLTYHFQLFLQIMQVLFLTTTLYFVSKLVHDPVPLQRYGGDYFEFAVIGLMIMSFVGVGLTSLSRSISDEQRAGTLEVLLSSPASMGGVLSGAAVIPFSMAGIQAGLLFVASILLFGAHFRIEGILPAVPLFALTAVSIYCIGVFSAAFVVLTKRGDPITVFATQLTTFLAGAVFPTTVMPEALRVLSRFVPTYYSLDGLRIALLTGGHGADLARDFLALTGFAIVLFVVSKAAFARSLRIARATGTLGNY
jgi:ABC-2 type transport system permease protein